MNQRVDGRARASLYRTEDPPTACVRSDLVAIIRVCVVTLITHGVRPSHAENVGTARVNRNVIGGKQAVPAVIVVFQHG